MYRPAARVYGTLLGRHRGKDLRLSRLAKLDCGGTAWGLAMSNMGAKQHELRSAISRGIQQRAASKGIKKMGVLNVVGLRTVA
jgi:hypothetical protein